MRADIAMRNQEGLLSNIGQFSKELFRGLCSQIVQFLPPAVWHRLFMTERGLKCHSYPLISINGITQGCPMNIVARDFAILFVRIDGLALQLRVLINPLHCFLQSKIVGGIFRRESFIELSLMG